MLSLAGTNLSWCRVNCSRERSNDNGNLQETGVFVACRSGLRRGHVDRDRLDDGYGWIADNRGELTMLANATAEFVHPGCDGNIRRRFDMRAGSPANKARRTRAEESVPECASCHASDDLVTYGDDDDIVVAFCDECLTPISSLDFPEYYCDFGGGD